MFVCVKRRGIEISLKKNERSLSKVSSVVDAYFSDTHKLTTGKLEDPETVFWSGCRCQNYKTYLKYLNIHIILLRGYHIGRIICGMNCPQPLIHCGCGFEYHSDMDFCAYSILAYFPGVARVFIYSNLIFICVPSLTDLHTVTSPHQLFSGVPNSKHLYIARHQVTYVATNMLQTVTWQQQFSSTM
jgi:hypothetical protein